MLEIILKFEFKLLQGMVLTSLNVHSSNLGKTQLDKFRDPSDPNTYKGEIVIRTTTDKVTFSISGVGSHSGLKGTFNFTIEDKKVFKEDQELSVNYFGRIAFFKTNVKLPI
jgi:hypothetical protein